MDGILPLMKLEHYDQYQTEHTTRAEAALLTVWAALGNLTDDLVLIGGLVPRYLCRVRPGEVTAVTMDVDLGVALELSAGQYETTSRRLADHGFRWHAQRFVKVVAGTELFLDLLTDKPSAEAPDSVTVDDVSGIAAVYGVARALQVCRTVRVSGHDLQGACVAERVRICEVGPYLCLKLQAYAARAQGKDVFDIVRVVRDYDGGVAEAIRAFQAERDVNPAYAMAVDTLRARFGDERAKGPAQYANFCLPGTEPASADRRFGHRQRANEALDVAHLLLGPAA
jgi:hypothetical protein